MIPDVVPYLCCPVCRADLTAAQAAAQATATTAAEAATPTALRCPRGHTFNIARQGYVDLSAGRLPHSGDTAAMVAARDAFLAAGHFAPVTAALATHAVPGLVVDVGAGTGHHLAAVVEAAPSSVGIALDVSKPALRRAARVHPRIGAALADAWGPLPVRDGAAATILNVFAPRNAAEFRRILAPDGRLLVVTPTPRHLRELVERLGLIRVDPDKEERVAATLDADFAVVDRTRVEATLDLDRDGAAQAVAMGPSAWHRAAAPDRLPDRLAVTVSVDVTTYAPR
jgi:23S rRNA (guanine745-N1)-methyltransferase